MGLNFIAYGKGRGRPRVARGALASLCVGGGADGNFTSIALLMSSMHRLVLFFRVGNKLFKIRRTAK